MMRTKMLVRPPKKPVAHKTAIKKPKQVNLGSAGVTATTMTAVAKELEKVGGLDLSHLQDNRPATTSKKQWKAQQLCKTATKVDQWLRDNGETVVYLSEEKDVAAAGGSESKEDPGGAPAAGASKTNPAEDEIEIEVPAQVPEDLEDSGPPPTWRPHLFSLAAPEGFDPAAFLEEIGGGSRPLFQIIDVEAFGRTGKRNR